MSENILLIDKPKGITSFDCIRILRRELGIKKMGHSGTLDPLASGLMLIGVQAGTKKLTDLIGLPKTYIAEILLGKKTTTGDLEGEVLKEAEVKDIDLTKVVKVLDDMVGEIDLPVPAYSAIKVKGQALYKKARAGQEVETPIKTMEIRSVKILETFPFEDCFVLKIEIDVKSGTYIRSIAEEVGERLGLPATIKELRRTRIGDYDIKDAQKLNTDNFYKKLEARSEPPKEVN